MNHDVVCGNGRKIFVTIIEGSLKFDLILLKRGCQHPSKKFEKIGKSSKIRFHSYFHIL